MTANTVLIVEDDPIILEIHSNILSSMGYEIMIAHNGEEALEVFSEKSRDIKFILCDYAMPKLNGMELSRSLEKLAPEVPVIICSGYSEDIILNTELIRPRYYLSKPFSIKALTEVIARTLNH